MPFHALPVQIQFLDPFGNYQAASMHHPNRHQLRTYTGTLEGKQTALEIKARGKLFEKWSFLRHATKWRWKQWSFTSD